MSFDFNLNKRFKILNDLGALFNCFALSLAFSTLVWVTVNLLIFVFNGDYDVLGIDSFVLYICLIFIGILLLFTKYVKSPKGVRVGNDAVEITTGIYNKYVSQSVSIALDDIISCEYIASYSKSKDGRRSILYGVCLKNIPAVRLTVKSQSDFEDEIHILPLNKSKEFTEYVNSIKN